MSRAIVSFRRSNKLPDIWGKSIDLWISFLAYHLFSGFRPGGLKRTILKEAVCDTVWLELRGIEAQVGIIVHIFVWNYRAAIHFKLGFRRSARFWLRILVTELRDQESGTDQAGTQGCGEGSSKHSTFLSTEPFRDGLTSFFAANYTPSTCERFGPNSLFYLRWEVFLW